MIRVYGLTGCGPCEVVKLFLKQKNLPFEFLDVQESPEARQKVLEMVGTLTAGVVLEVNGEPIALSGVSIPKLEAWYQEYLRRWRT
ncbi:glutaredoxin [Allomeiothermus silvanus DSM 9946]|uniref:Glutaredoxin n=1 Tax=Allomeiothermus silvanus (strain ATCC 700542 / DSM 9946 / NBRC 106475 / NCIMB 13440 / VI-R2) TaxID=526227 RepID=D7BGT8_ALLS1|nr:glutaredoxin domain-containing protein [Allomeiothermus silvanus]ADH62092.1 glutaredoxin [Allomeiothermus silvanus DSM 9946]